MARSGALPKKLHVFVPKMKREESEQEDEDETDEEENDGEGGEGDEGGDERRDKQVNGEAKDIEVPEDIRQVVRLLTNGVPLDDLRLECSNADDLKKLLKFLPLDGSKASSKLRPWDCINSLSLSFEEGCLLDEPDALAYFLPRFSKNITSFELRLPDSKYMPLDSDILLEVPGFMELPQNFAEKLTSFSILCDWGVQHMFILLKHCANLGVLTLDFLSLYSEWEWTAEECTALIGGLPQVKLPKLHTLRLRACPPEIIRMLGSLQAPVLVHLDFESVLDCQGVAEDLLTFLTTESNYALTLNSLRLADIQFDAMEFCQVLDELPALTHLALQEVYFDGGDLLQQFDERCRSSQASHPGVRGIDRHLREQPKPFLPNLQVLELIGQVDGENFIHLVRFIDSREELFKFYTQASRNSKLVGSADGSLKELIVGYYHPYLTSHLDPRSPLRERLRRSGMHLNIFACDA
jgi:hypothetical protein